MKIIIIGCSISFIPSHHGNGCAFFRVIAISQHELHSLLAASDNTLKATPMKSKKYLLKIASENAKEQKDIQDNFKLIDNALSKFHTEIKSTHYVRQSLEDEITKLKNIIKRHNKQKEQ